MKPVDAEDMSQKVAMFDMSNQVEKEREVTTERLENKNDSEQDNSPGRTEDAETGEDRDDNQMEDYEKTERGTESAQHSGDDGEDDKEQTDEPEF